MKKSEKFKLTENEKKVLKQIINEGRVSDTDMADDMTISQQAVYQIRKRLEDAGIIKGYSAIIDFKKIGVNIFTFVGIDIRPKYWDRFKESEISNKLKKLPCIYGLFRTPASDISYILTFGFKDMLESDRFMKHVETLLADGINIVWSYQLSVDNIIKHDGLNLIYHSLEGNFDKVKKVLKEFSD